MRQNVQTNEVAALGKQLPEKCVERISELTDDCRLLVVSHMPLAYAMAWRLRDYGLSLDDLQQEGFLGLCEAAIRYDENVDVTFAAYAAYWCRKMMLAAIHRGRTTARHEPDNPIPEPEDTDVLRQGQRRRIADALQDLPRVEQQVIRRFYGLDTKRLSMAEIATALGISKSKASALHRHALAELESALMRRPLVDYLTPWLE